MLIKTLYSVDETENKASEDIEGLAKDACEECIQILREPEKSQAKPAIKVLCAFMETTRTGCDFPAGPTILKHMGYSICCSIYARASNTPSRQALPGP